MNDGPTGLSEAAARDRLGSEGPNELAVQRPPRLPNAHLFSAPMVAIAVLQGASVLAISLYIYTTARVGHGADAARGLTFVSMVVAFIVMILINRSWTRTLLGMMREPNAALWWVITGAAAILALVVWVPGVQGLFHFAALHVPDLGLSLAAGGLCLLWFEALKLTGWWRRIR